MMALRHYYAFRHFHMNNPHIYELFKRFTFEVRDAGLSHYSARAVFDRIRWWTMVETVGEPFKISNNHSPYYASMFMREFPEMRGFFRTKLSRVF